MSRYASLSIIAVFVADVVVSRTMVVVVVVVVRKNLGVLRMHKVSKLYACRK